MDDIPIHFGRLPVVTDGLFVYISKADKPLLLDCKAICLRYKFSIATINSITIKAE
jgi:hypothetical protein